MGDVRELIARSTRRGLAVPVGEALIDVTNACSISIQFAYTSRRDAPGPARRSRRPRTQPQGRHGRVPARPSRGHHRALRQRQEQPRVRHDLRRGPASLRREPERLRPPVPGPDGEAGRRPDRRAVARRSRSTRRARRATRARPSARSPRSTTTSACSSPGSASRTAPTAIRSSARASSRSSTRCWRCPRARGSSSSARSSRTARPRATASSRAPGGRASSASGSTGRCTTCRRRRRSTSTSATRSRSSSTATSSAGPRRRRARSGTSSAGRSTRRPAPRPGPGRVRLADSIETALRLGEGVVLIAPAPATARRRTFEERRYSERYTCPYDGTTIDDLEPRSFSFNSPHGACPSCTGLGTRLEIDPDLVIPDRSKSLAKGALVPWAKMPNDASWRLKILEADHVRPTAGTTTRRSATCRRRRSTTSSTRQKDEKVLVRYKHERGENTYKATFEGDRHEPRAALPRDGLGVHQDRAREVHGHPALPDLRRQAAEAGDPRRHDRRPDIWDVSVDVDHRGPCLGRRAPEEAVGPRADDRLPGPQGDHGPARLPRRRRARLPGARPGARSRSRAARPSGSGWRPRSGRR